MSENMDFPAHLFRGYDIRGPVEDFDLEVVEDIGRGFVELVGAKKVAIGMDMRKSSPRIKAALITGIVSMGADVIDIGMCTTPMIYNTVGMLDDVDGGVMVTASHCASHMNGIKMCRSNVAPIGFGSGMEELREIVRDKKFERAQVDGVVAELEMKDVILDKMFEYVGDIDVSSFSIVCDAANAVSSLILPNIIDRLGCKSENLFFDLDDSFPNHEANPIKLETLRSLQDKVVEVGASVGFAFDGDGDRISVVDEGGRVVPSDYLATIIGLAMLEDNPGGLILGDIRNTRDMKNAIEAAGGKFDTVPVGHSNIKKAMRESGPIFAGELSGHMYFSEFFNAESNTLTMLFLLRKMKESGKKLSELYDEIKKSFQSGEINFEVKDKDGMMKELQDTYMGVDGAELNTMDGVRIDFADWWFNVRPSANDPVLRLNVEGADEETMVAKRDELQNRIETSEHGGPVSSE